MKNKKLRCSFVRHIFHHLLRWHTHLHAEFCHSSAPPLSAVWRKEQNPGQLLNHHNTHRGGVKWWGSQSKLGFCSISLFCLVVCCWASCHAVSLTFWIPVHEGQSSRRPRSACRTSPCWPQTTARTKQQQSAHEILCMVLSMRGFTLSRSYWTIDQEKGDLHL